MSNFQRTIQAKTSTSTKDYDLKRKRFSDDDDDDQMSSESVSSPPSSDHIPMIEFEIQTGDVKYELMQYDSIEPGPSAGSPDDDLGLEECAVEGIKAESEDDPLIFTGKPDGCDAGFSPATGDSLPVIDLVAILEFLSTFQNYDKEHMRALLRQNSELIDESIGYVQLKREDSTCTVKCVVATKTTSNDCVIFYNEPCTTIQAAICNCTNTICRHIMTALIWLCRPKGPITYWMMPMVCREPSSIRISSIFDQPKVPQQKENSILKEFVLKCGENEIFSPLVMKYYQNEKPLAYLHRLMGMFKHKSTCLEHEFFCDFYRQHITKEEIASLSMLLSPKVIQELEYGRITDTLLLDACLASSDDEVEKLVASIMNPEMKETVKLKYGVIPSLEATVTQTIKRRGLFLSDTSPIFSASPYGITKTHVVFIKNMENSDPQESGKNGSKISPKDTACMQLQMCLAKKKNACYCEVLSSNKIVVSIIKYNEKWLLGLLRKATMFWQVHIFQRILENTK